MPKSCQYSTRIQYKPRALGKCVNRAFGPVASRTRASRCCIVVKPRGIGELFVHLKVRGQKLHSIFATQSTIARITMFASIPLAIFSAASSDKFERYEHQAQTQRPQTAMRWRYEYRPGTDREGWGLYFEKMGPGSTFSDDERQGTADQEEGNVGGGDEKDEESVVSSYSHGLPTIFCAQQPVSQVDFIPFYL